jgi:hypothetical protein
VAVDNGELTFGLKKNDDNPGGNWTMFDNFTLSYFGTAPEAYQMCLEKGMPAKAEYSTANVSKQYIDAYDAAYTMTATDKASLSAAVRLFLMLMNLSQRTSSSGLTCRLRLTRLMQ